MASAASAIIKKSAYASVMIASSFILNPYFLGGLDNEKHNKIYYGFVTV